MRACLWHRVLCWSWGCLGAVRRRHGCTHSAVFTPQHSLRCDTSGRLYSGPSKWMEMRTEAPMWNTNSYSNSDLTPGPSASPHPRGANAAHFDPASLHPVTARLHMSVVHLHYSVTPSLPPYSPFPNAVPVYSNKSLIRRKTDVTERRDEQSSSSWELSSPPRSSDERWCRDFEWRPQPQDRHRAVEWFSPSFEEDFIVLWIPRNSKKSWFY